MMENNTGKFPAGKTKRIILFCDLRDSTDILLNYEQGIYRSIDDATQKAFTYEEFMLDVHETSYKELYLGHENTYAEIYGDGVMGIFPEDNAKYILENIYRLTKRMRIYNDSPGVGIYKPRIDIGFGLAVEKRRLFIIHWINVTTPLAGASTRPPELKAFPVCMTPGF